MNWLSFSIGMICGMIVFDGILFFILAHFKIVKTKKFTKKRLEQCFTFTGVYHLYKYLKKGVE